MQTLDINHHELPDLQFALTVAALCTSDIPTLNVPADVRHMVFERCWALLHDTPVPEDRALRVLDLRQGDDVTLDALVEVIRATLTSHGYTQLTWDHEPSEPTQATSPEAQPLIDRLHVWNPAKPRPADDGEAGKPI